MCTAISAGGSPNPTTEGGSASWPSEDGCKKPLVFTYCPACLHVVLEAKPFAPRQAAPTRERMVHPLRRLRAVDEEGCCSPLSLGLLTEVSRGLQRFLVYLARWAEFRDWELAHSHQLGRE